MLQELVNYHRVRLAWGLGPLKIKRRQGTLDIWAEYFDIESNRTPEAFLGGGKGQSARKQALQHVQHVKSFLQSLKSRCSQKTGCFVDPKKCNFNVEQQKINTTFFEEK